MYCDFCGIKLAYNVRYCSKCGRQLKDNSGDTQPIPVIDATILRKTPTNKSKAWRIMYYLISVAILAGLIYILATFKTIKQYQILTSIMGGLLAIYVWWKR